MKSSAWEFEAKYEQWLPGLAQMRDALIQPLSKADLGYSVGGSSLTWGQLLDDCAQMQRSYLDAFGTRTAHRFSCRPRSERSSTFSR